MSSIDLRSRGRSEPAPLEVTTFMDGVLGEALDARADDVGRTALRLGLPPLTLVVDGEALTLVPGTPLTAHRRTGEAVQVAMDAAAFGALVHDAASFFGLEMTGRSSVQAGDADRTLEWEPVLRYLLDGRRVHREGDIAFTDRTGSPLDLSRSFTFDDDRADIGHFLGQAGFLHLRGVFTTEEMAAVSADLDRAIAVAEPDDGASWWAATEAGERYPARILGFNRSSPALRELMRSERFGAIGTFTDDEFVQRDPDEGDSAEGLLKKVGVVQGISDVSWHKDCAMGGHSRSCCGLTVGISVTGAGPTNGELGAVAGSHRANIPVLGIEGLDLPRRALPTETGDVTVHCSCTLHMSRPPVSAERRVVYTGFGLALRDGDQPTPAVRSERAALNDRVRAPQGVGASTSRRASFDL